MRNFIIGYRVLVIKKTMVIILPCDNSYVYFAATISVDTGTHLTKNINKM